MKLLTILNDLDLGGTQNYTISLVNEFIEMGHSVDLIVLSDTLSLKDRLNTKVVVQILPRRTKLDFIILRKIRIKIADTQYDAVISSYAFYTKLATLFLHKNKSIIFPIHFTVITDLKSIIINYILFRLKHKNEVFLTSIEAQTTYLSNKYKLKKNFFFQIYNGVDTKKFTPPPTSFNRKEFLLSKGIDPGNKIILMVAGFRKEKRHKDAINAFTLFKNFKKNVSFVCIGDNRKEEFMKIKEYANKKNSTNLYIFNAKNAGDLIQWYWSSNIFTLTSDSVETFPITSLEAMACGLPCVLTDTGGMKDLIKNNSSIGVLVQPRDINSIHIGWLKCFNNLNSISKKYISSIIKEKYSISSSAIQYIDLINKTNVN